jgi:tetratricopeptide (TPR) repeat protein
MPFANILQVAFCFLVLGLGGCSSLQPKPEPNVIESHGQTETTLPPELTNMFSDALTLLKNEEFEESEQVLLTITNKYPNYAGPWTNLAIAQLSLEKYDDSLISVDKALVIDNQFCQSLSLKGVILRELGQFSDAKVAYLKAVECDSSDFISLYNLGVLSDLYLHDEVAALFYYQSYLVALNDTAGDFKEEGSKEKSSKDSTVESWVVGLKRRVPEEQRMALVVKKDSSEKNTKTLDANAQPPAAEVNSINSDRSSQPQLAGEE